MSVYTSLTAAQMADFIGQFALGELLAFKGISAGIENTNYFVTTSEREWVLTMFEHQGVDEVRELVRLAIHLGEKAMLVPAPVANKNGQWLLELKGKPAILCPRLPGAHIKQPQAKHCAAIGTALAQLHLNAEDLQPRRHNNRGYHWWLSAGPALTALLPADQQQTLASELEFQQQHTDAWLALPTGWIHGDLFYDNALFADGAHGQLSVAILDLYNACEGAYLFDVAVVANDWCCNPAGELKPELVQALWQGYQSVRPFTALEQQHWPLVLRAAALRFWLSRLLTRQQQQAQGGELALQKDPMEFMHKLRLRQLLRK